MQLFLWKVIGEKFAHLIGVLEPTLEEAQRTVRGMIEKGQAPANTLEQQPLLVLNETSTMVIDLRKDVEIRVPEET